MSRAPMDSDARTSNPDSALLRDVLDRELGAVPDVLEGVQKRLRERSGGRFYADEWSTSRHPPTAIYLLTSLLMLAVCGLLYLTMRPLSGDPEPTNLTPAPVEILPPR